MDNQNPEDLFWSLIESDPTNPTHRLIFADWCDENDQLDMGDVQRWLAATGRHPQQIGPNWYWFKESPFRSDQSCLPSRLFARLLGTGVYSSKTQEPDGVVFGTIREAERSMANAWDKATRPRWFSFEWKPKVDLDRKIRPKIVRSEKNTLSEALVQGVGYFMIAVAFVMLLRMITWSIK